MGEGLRAADRLLLTLVPPLGAAWLRLIRATMRLEWQGAETALPDDRGPVIYAFWHSQLAMMPWVQLRPPSVVPISKSRDGEWTARLFQRLQVEVVRGSSSRGGVTALRALVVAARQGKDLAITPDGPRGPSGCVQPGAIWLSRLTGRPLLPLAFACRPVLRLASWDRMILPLPFGRGAFLYGEPIWVPTDADRRACAALQERLARQLDELTLRAATSVSLRA
ncbi:MAG: lysophospholipid acyltransferase family protein [Acidobacteriota bacterium]